MHLGNMHLGKTAMKKDRKSYYCRNILYLKTFVY